MDFPMAQAPLDYPIFFGMEPLTLLGTDAQILGRNTVRHRPMRDYHFLSDCSLPDAVTPTNG